MTPKTLPVQRAIPEYTGLSQRQVNIAAQSGALPTILAGRARVARVEAIEEWLRSMEVRGVTPDRSEVAMRTKRNRAAGVAIARAAIRRGK